LLESEKFPRWVEDRFNYQERLSNHKQKLPKKRSPWWTLPQVAMAAKGNSMGAITDLKTSALAAGRSDLAEQLAAKLEAALEQLKHGTEGALVGRNSCPGIAVNRAGFRFRG
jgi:hypothetical protein